MASAYQILGNPQSRESYDNERLGHRGDPRDFDHEDLGRDGEMPRQRVYKTPKPVYNSYGAHGEHYTHFEVLGMAYKGLQVSPLTVTLLGLEVPVATRLSKLG